MLPPEKCVVLDYKKSYSCLKHIDKSTNGTATHCREGGSTRNWKKPKKYYKLNSILRRHYGFIMTASWEKIYSVLGGVAKRRSPIRNIVSPNAVIIKP